MERFITGDIVQHAILEVEKIIVGVGRDRYLCVHSQDIGPDGRVRPDARVALHRAINLKKVGFREGIVGVDLNNLYKRESLASHPLRKRWFRQEILAQALFILAAVMIVLAVLSVIDMARERIDKAVDVKVEGVKTQMFEKYRQEYEKMRHDSQRR